MEKKNVADKGNTAGKKRTAKNNKVKFDTGRKKVGRRIYIVILLLLPGVINFILLNKKGLKILLSTNVDNNFKQIKSYNLIPTDEERELYQTERERNYTGINIRKIVYSGCCGLGHRLTRMSAAYHVAKVTNSSRLFASWGSECGPNEDGNPDIFDNLFGAGPMIVDPLVSVRNEGANITHGWESSVWWHLHETRQLPKRLMQYHYNNSDVHLFANDVPSYYSGKTISEIRSKVNRDIILEKLVSDVEFFHQLRVLFRFNHIARNFTDYHRFDDHMVIGLHIRAGNGETGDFDEKGRGVKNIDVWLEAAAKTLDGLSFTPNNTNDESDKIDLQKPPLIFLATDTPSVISKLSNYIKPYGIPLVTFSQERTKDGSGVSFNHRWNKLSSCHQSWVNQFMDATILSASNVVVAGKYSSFTQSVPLTTMLAGSILGAIGVKNKEFNRDRVNKKAFCEMNFNGNGLECYDDYKEWVFADRRPGLRSQHVKEIQLPGILG